METSTGTFAIEDAFTITARGLVLAGVVQGEMAAGYQLLLPTGGRCTVKGVNYINTADRRAIVGLLVDAPVISRQELLTAGIIGSTVLILISPNA